MCVCVCVCTCVCVDVVWRAHSQESLAICVLCVYDGMCVVLSANSKDFRIVLVLCVKLANSLSLTHTHQETHTLTHSHTHTLTHFHVDNIGQAVVAHSTHIAARDPYQTAHTHAHTTLTNFYISSAWQAIMAQCRSRT